MQFRLSGHAPCNVHLLAVRLAVELDQFSSPLDYDCEFHDCECKKYFDSGVISLLVMQRTAEATAKELVEMLGGDATTIRAALAEAGARL